MTPDEILRKHEDGNEMHFHDVDRKWIIEAMEEYAAEKSEKPIISDEEIGKGCDENIPLDEADMWSERLYFRIGAKWYREQLKKKL